MMRSPDAAPSVASAERASGHPPTAAFGPVSSAPTLALKGIVKSWNADRPRLLDGVTLAVGTGTTILVSGRNGAGKTTLLRIAAALITPERGEVRLNGLDPERNRREFQRRLGHLAAGNTGLYARLKLELHLDFWARLALVPRARRASVIERTIDAFELRSLMGRRVDRLSMGQRQRLRLALAFLHEPELVLLDEPTTSLDQDGIVLLDRALAELKGRGGAALLCAASGDELHLAYDKEYLLGGGRLEAA